MQVPFIQGAFPSGRAALAADCHAKSKCSDNSCNDQKDQRYQHFARFLKPATSPKQALPLLESSLS